MLSEKQAVHAIRGKLLDFLQQEYDEGITLNQHFSCPNPDHDDSSPSAIIQDRGSEEYSENVGYCFGCQTSFNIFTLAYWLKSYPIEGLGFWRLTLPTLAEEYDIEYEREELSDEDRKELMKYRAYADAANVIIDNAKCVEDLIIERKWSLEMAEKFKFGGIPDVNTYITAMENQGWTGNYLRSVGLLNEMLFRPKSIIFVICNEYGQPCAFATRNTEEEGPKYINSENSDIYQKRNILYNLYKLKKNDRSTVYIVEGYADVISMIKSGVERVVAVGGTALTEDHANLLFNWGAAHIQLAFDGDEAGIIATKRAINNLANNQQFKVKVLIIPEGEDPDSLVKKGRVLSTPTLPRISPFEWTLRHLMKDPETDAIELATDMISSIVIEPNLMRRQEMMAALSAATGIDQSTIAAQIRKVETERMFEKKEKENEIKNKLAMLARRTDKGLDEILSRIRGEWELTKTSFSTDAEAGIEPYVQAVEDIRESLLHREEISGFKLTKFSKLLRDLGGIPDRQSMIVVAGKPGTGKTSWLRFLTLDLIRSNPDIFVLYMSIDDTRQKMIPSLIATMKRLSLRECFRPKSIMDSSRRALWEKAFADLTNGMKSQLSVEDRDTGNTLDALESHVELYKRTFPDKKLLVVLDNFHLLADNTFSFGHSEREKTKANSMRLKGISVKYDIPIIITAELRKVAPNRRPTEEDINETGQVHYDADLTLMLHNDRKMIETSPIYIEKQLNGISEKRQVLEVKVRKNKISGYDGWWLYEYQHLYNYFKEIDKDSPDHQRIINLILKSQVRENGSANKQMLGASMR